MSDTEARLAAALADNAKLREALRETVDWIVALGHSGDAGFWDPEKVPEVIRGRAALHGDT